MTGRATDWLLAVAGGVLLTLMTQFNGELAHHTTPVFASWTAHALGALVALALVALTARAAHRANAKRSDAVRDAAPPERTPLWFRLGGIPGAFVVMLSAIAVNSGLELAGTVALMLTGQVLFGIASDRWGLLRIPRRRITALDLTVAGCVLAGSVLIVVGA
ncbi:DMT family transporter [Streptomyces sp. NPDC050504]|uniref:DMT family transporter n=1 Tax=Streptomyces sp. NPDC050504 TaxID=3365618 RepID=UPI0037BCC5FF